MSELLVMHRWSATWKAYRWAVVDERDRVLVWCIDYERAKNWMRNYIAAEAFQVDIDLRPKPVKKNIAWTPILDVETNLL